MNNDFDSDEEQEKEQGTVRLLTLFIKGCVLHWRFKNTENTADFTLQLINGYKMAHSLSKPCELCFFFAN